MKGIGDEADRAASVSAEKAYEADSLSLQSRSENAEQQHSKKEVSKKNKTAFFTLLLISTESASFPER